MAIYEFEGKQPDIYPKAFVHHALLIEGLGLNPLSFRINMIRESGLR